MADDCLEEIVTARNQKRRDMLYALVWVLIIVLGLHAALTLCLLLTKFDATRMGLCIVSTTLAGVLLAFKDNLKTEYEYAFSDGTLQFAKVTGGARRKELGTLRMRDVSACGDARSEQAARFLNMRDAVRRNWFLNRDAKLFFFYTVDGDKRMVTVIEPSDALVETIRRSLPMGIARG